MKHITYYLLFLMFLCGSCTSLQHSPKYNLADGVYRTTLRPGAKSKKYVEVDGDTINVFGLTKSGKETELDSAVIPEALLADIRSGEPPAPHTFVKPSLDLDLITIPVKYRPRAEGFPRQMTTSLQAAVYLGYRSDLYRVTYRRSPLGWAERNINHFGISAGFFSGLGSSPVQAQLTRQQVQEEYEGVIFLNGLAALVAVNNFTVGMAVGADLLLDRNHRHWIYNRKPWVGVVFGLNLN